MSKKKLASTKVGSPATAGPKPGSAADAARPKAPEGARANPTPPVRPPFRRPQNLNFAGVGRNDICPCGSGKRFKNCHGH